jgi:tetratricopeptide (TPR) repeat protein
MPAYTSAQVSPGERQLLASIEQGIDKGSYSDIEGRLMQFVVSHPNDASGLRLLGRLRFRQGRLNEARSLYQRSIILDPKAVRTKVDLSVTLYELSEVGPARELLKEISIESTLPVELLHLSQAFVMVGEYNDALRAIERLPAIVKNGAALPLRVKSYLALDRPGDVTKLLPMARMKVPGDPDAATAVASVLVGTAFNKDAVGLLALILRNSPKNVPALLLMGRAKVNERDLASARALAAKAASLDPRSPEAAYLVATIESEQGRYTEALAAFEQALALSPSSVEVMSQAIVAAMRANKSRRAVEIARDLIRLKPDDPDSVYLFGAASLQAGRIADAEAYLGRYVLERPKDGRGCVAFALSLAAQPSKIDLARNNLEGCVATDPANFEATYQLALSYRSSGDAAKAIEYLERTVKLSPNYAVAVRELGAMYLQSGKEEQARIHLERAVKLAPDDADGHFQLSRLYNLIGQPALAKQHFDIFQKLRNPGSN